jgi:glycosyltransferase involved in cell wall biosynthesis
VASVELPSFDLIVATVDRVEQLKRLFASLDRQTHRRFRLLLVDQNDDDRLDQLLEHHSELDVQHLRSARGLSRARNVALPRVAADIVAFPDDDCTYPPELLERVARRLAGDGGLDGLTGRAVDVHGHSSPSWERTAARLTRDNLWNRAISFTIFLRSPVLESVGAFDEQLGLGSQMPWSSGEEIEYLVRAVDDGRRIEYDPELVVLHDEKVSPRAVGGRDGASIGYILRKHRYPIATVGKMLIRPLGGALFALARGDRERAAYHVATLHGRVRGYRS